MEKIIIKKRGGDTEAFSLDKLVVSIGKSGVPMKESLKIAKKIEDWLKETTNEGSVSSSQIRDKVIEYMKNQFPAETDSYSAYKK